jgi:hypothetical protein
MPAVEQAELVATPAGLQVADASEEAEWLFDALEEEAEEEAEAEGEAYEEAEEASADDDAQADSEADVSGEASAEASAEAGGGEAAGVAAASSGGISSAWLWGGLAVAGAAAAASGGDSTPKTPEPPTVTLDTDSGTAGDGITNVATFTVGGLENNTTWEYSTDGGATWSAGSGSSFQISADGDYTVVVRQTRGQKVSENSASVDVTLDTSTPTIGSGDSGSVDENSATTVVLYTASAEDNAEVTYSLQPGGDELLSIDPVTGEVTVVVSPDFETQESYTFTVIATDVAGNAAEQVVTVTVNNLDEVAPTITSGAAVTAIDENTAAGQVIYTATADDSADISGGVTFSLKAGSDAALSIDGATGAVTLAGSPDFETQSTYDFTVVATDAAGNSSEQALTLNINDLDEIPPEVLSVTGDSATETVTLTFNEALSSDPLPDASTFAVSQGGNPIAVTSVAVNGANVVLTLGGDLVAGPVQIVYTPGAGNNVTDVAGNESAGFTQLVVSDGYIRGASIYLDANNDGIAQTEELIEGATTDANGQVILPDDIESGTLLIVGGVNMDTGAINKIVIKTKVGNTAANPLTTLVETVKASGGLTDEEAEQVVATGLGITLQAGQSLSTYDPIADTSAEGLAARKAVATVATILASAANTAADAGAADAVVSSVATNIATQLVTAASQATPTAVTFDEATVTEVLKDSSGAAVGDATVVQNVTTSVQTIKDAVSVDVIVETQAKATDTVAPDAPDVEVATASDSGESNSDGVTNDSTPTITVSFETDATDGTAVVVGNLVEVLVGGNVVGSATVTEANLKAGSVDIDAGVFNEGDTSVVARITDKAGNVSELASAITVSVDTQGPLITSDGFNSVDENDGSDLEVYTAAATDTNTLVYSLAEGASADLSIDADTGVVTLAGADFESQESYVFTVVATDLAGNKSERAVTLSINNVDEVAPTITSGATAQAIDENSGAEQVVYTAVADDSADISGGVMFSLADGSDAGLTINAQTGAVTLTGDPDHETQSSYSFTVVAKDAAGNETTKDVTLAINDLDEVAPTITSGATATALDENSAADSVVYTVTSTDDEDISGGVTYSLGEGSDQAITINGETGEVTLTGVANFEQQDSYTFVVEAMDAAGNKSMQTVTLAINNLDEVAPSFTSGDEITAVDENIDAGATIYTATVDDSGDISGGVTFSLKEGSAAGIEIDADTGVVTLTESPDYETTPAYNFTIVATDEAGNFSEKALTLAVNDLDEGPPVFTSGATASVNENVEAGTAVYTAAATDGSPITFSLAEEDASNFTIDAQTGVVSIVGSPNYEDQTEYTFTVTATDSADNADSLEVTLSVNNLDEADPVITSGGTAAAIDENSGADQVIYTATATDDGDISGGVMFSLAEGSDAALSINGETGAVTLSTNPDHETQSSYQFTVIAKDAAGNMSEQAVSLSINDLDEANPIITSDSLVEIDENGPASAVIYTATATDDGDISEGVTFSLGEGTSDAFTIDGDTGEVTFDGPADFEDTSSYVFTVVATDGAGNKDERAVTVLVNNLDEVAPVITSGDTADAIAENTPAGAVVYTATATDEGDVSEGVVFSLAEGSDAALSINAQTGEVTLNEIPDFETQDSYSFTVVATDGAGNTDEQAVTLAVTNVDESAPTFTSGTTGNALLGTPYLYQARVEDAGDTSAGVTFSLENSGDADLLQIDSEDGAVSVRTGVVLPVAETGGPASYTFTVIADDGVTTPSTQTVTIDVGEPTLVVGPGVIEQGAIRVELTEVDGRIQLDFFVDDSYVAEFPFGVDNFVFAIKYDPDLFAAIPITEIQVGPTEFNYESEDFSSPAGLVTINGEVPGTFVVGGVATSPIQVDKALGTLLLTPLTTDNITIGIEEVVLGQISDPIAPTLITFGATSVVTGSDSLESFILVGGDAEVTGGGDIDLFVATSTTGDQTVITDFTPSEDFIEMSLVLFDAGYDVSDDEPTSVVDFKANLFSDINIDNLDQIQANADEFDNTYGILVDETNGLLVGFYDTDPLSNSVAMQTFSVTIGSEAASSMTIDNVTAQLNDDQNAGSGDGNGNPLEPVFAFISGTSEQGLTGTPFLYQAEVNSLGLVQFSLDQASADYDLLTIDPETGVVMLKDGVLNADVKDQYTFTVIAADGVNTPITQPVTSSIVAATTVTGGNDSVTQGGILAEETSMSDQPPYELSFYVDESAVGNYTDGVNAFTFSVNYDATQFDAITSSDFTVDTAFEATIDDSTPGVIVVSGTLPQGSSAYLPANGGALASVLVTPIAEGEDIAIDITSVSLTDVLGTATQQTATNLVFGSSVIVDGTAGNDSFVVGAGVMDITGGEGVDAYIITADTGMGDDVYITDFMPGEDLIDMSALMQGLGYQSITDQSLALAENGVLREYSTDTSVSVLELVEINDFSLDNTFGMAINTDTGSIIGFYDADSDANSVDMKTFELNIGEAVADITLDDLTVGIGGFIA